MIRVLLALAAVGAAIAVWIERRRDRFELEDNDWVGEWLPWVIEP